MKKLVLLLLFSIGISYVYAGKFKVLFVNDASLKYTNGKVVKVGDTFKSAEDINWQKDKQAIKVFDLTAKKQMIFLGKEWTRKSGFDALVSQKRLSTNEAAGLPEDQKDPFMDIFEDEYLLLDPIEIPVKESIVLDENNHFEATYDYGDTRLTKPLRKGIPLSSTSRFSLLTVRSWNLAILPSASTTSALTAPSQHWQKRRLW